MTAKEARARQHEAKARAYEMHYRAFVDRAEKHERAGDEKDAKSHWQTAEKTLGKAFDEYAKASKAWEEVAQNAAA